MSVSKEILAMLKDYQAWRSGKDDFDLLDYAGCVATPDLFFGLLSLLMPELILYEGNYFLASHFDPSVYDEWMRRLGDPVAVQKVMNHIHISTLFQRQDVAPEVACAVARKIAEVWSLMFVEKGLVAEAYGTNLDDAEVTFFRAS